MYGMTVRVTIVDRDERDEQILITRWPKEQIFKIKNCITQFLENERSSSNQRPNILIDYNAGTLCLLARRLKPILQRY